MTERINRFLVALSFPGEHRKFVEDVADFLSRELGEGRVLYDRFHEAEFARPNLDTHLQALYHDQSRLVVVFLCSDYERKDWPGLEWRAIRDLIKSKKDSSIMLIRLDEANVSGVFSIDGYISVAGRAPRDIASLIIERLQVLEVEPQATISAQSISSEHPSGTANTTNPSHAARPRLSRLLIAAIASILLLATAIGLILFRIHRNNSNSVIGENKRAAPFVNREVVRITNIGKIKEAVISSDGKFVFYLGEDSERRVIRRRELITGSDRPIDICSTCEKLTVSPDGRYLYMIINPGSSNREARWRDKLTRLPLQEEKSPAEPLLNNVHSSITFSPNGAQFAFVRYLENDQKRALMIANSDGTGERELAISKTPEMFVLDGLTWSHQGHQVATGMRVMTPDSYYFQIVCIDVQSGRETYRSKKWQWLEQIAWLPDDSGFVLVGRDLSAKDSNNQIYYVSHPAGDVYNITRDLSNYQGVSVSRSALTLVTAQANVDSNIWTADLNGYQANQITFGSDRLEEISWSSDNTLVFLSYAGGTSSVWRMDPKGSGKKQIANTGGADDPSVSPDGRYLLVQLNVSGAPGIWRMDHDGANPKQLAERAVYPQCSPDGKWVVYTSLGTEVDGKRTLWKVSLDGGEPSQISDLYLNDVAISPDGKWIASNHWDENGDWWIVVIPFDGGVPAMAGKLGSDDADIRWLQDSESICYVRTDKGVSNIWVAKRTGGTPRRLTNFESDRILSFDISPDGKQLVVSRGSLTGDVALIKEAR